MPPPIRVLVADDHRAVREGVRALLALEPGIVVVGEAADGTSALGLARELKPDLIVLDNSMPGMSGLDVARTLSSELPDTGIVFLTMDPALRDLALSGGAMAYVLKDAPSDELLRAVRATTAALTSRRRIAGSPASWRRLVDLLISTRTLDGLHLDEVLAQRRVDESLAALLRRVEALPEAAIAELLAQASGTPLVSLAPYPEVGKPIHPAEDRLAATRMIDPIDHAAARSLPLDVARSLGVALIARDGTEGILAMADPLDEETLAAAQRANGLPRLTRVTATLPEIHDALARAWGSATTLSALPYRVIGAWRSLFAALCLMALPIAGLVLLFRESVTPDRFFALFALFCGFFFFAYALKYYVTSASVLAVALFGDTLVLGKRNGNGNGNGKGHGGANGAHTKASAGSKANGRTHKEGYKTLRGEKLDEAGAVLADAGPLIGEARLPIGRQPFISVHLALYNEKRVVDRLLAACTSLDYENYEVIVVDDSTDETVQALARWKNHPRVRVIHRSSRAGFKGGALQEALRRMNPRTEYVMIFDADFIPPADAVWHFLDYFGRLVANGNGHKKNGNGNGHHKNGNGAPTNGERLAAVQGYQWHMLNASENWITKGVRAEFAGSYVLERAGQELFGTMKMISGSVYMIRADVLRTLGWSTSITEDWELTIRLYLAGYKVLYTPYIQAPAECVSTISRLIKQRMRWAEGHTYNVKKYFLKVLRSPNLTWREKLEFIYYAPYYLQSVVFAAGTIAWLVAELLLGQRLPNWTALLGWSLVCTNVLALPLMNLAGVLLEGSLRRDAIGLLAFIALSMLLVPFQAYAALKGLLEREEGGWVRTPKSGRVTEEIGAFHLARLLPWELPKRRRPAAKQSSRGAQLALTCVASLLAVGIVAVGMLSIRAAAASSVVPETDFAIPGLVGTAIPLLILALGWLKLRRRLAVGLLALALGLSVNVAFLANAIPAAAATDNTSTFTFRNTTTFNAPNLDMVQNYTPPSGPSIAFVQSTSVISIATNPSLAYTSNVTAGNLLVMACKAGTSATITNVSDSLNGSWTQAVERIDGVDRLAIWYKANTLGGAVTVTCSTAGTDNALTIAEFSGVRPSAPLDQTASGSDPVGSVTLTTANTAALAQPGELVFAGGESGFNTFTAGTSDGTAFTIASQAAAGASNQSVMGEYILSSSANAQRGNATIGTSSVWIAVVATFTPAGSKCPATSGNNWTCTFASDTFSSIQSMAAGSATSFLYLQNSAAGSCNLTVQLKQVTGISFRSAASASGTGTGTATLTIAAPAGVAANDVLVASIAVRPSTAVITPPAGWVLVRRTDQPTPNSNSLAVYQRVAGATEPASYAWTVAAGTITARASGTTALDQSLGGQSLTLTKPAGVTQNDVMLAAIMTDAGVAATPPAGGWTEILFDEVATLQRSTLFWKSASNAEPASYIWTTVAPGNLYAGLISTYVGVDGAPVDGTPAGSTGTTTAWTAPSVTTTVANDWSLVVASSANTNTSTTPTGYTTRVSSVCCQSPYYLFDTALGAAGATGTVGGTWSTALGWTGQQATIQPIQSMQAVGGISAFAGVNTTTPVDVDAGQADPVGTTFDSPSVTTTGASEMIVTSAGFSSSDTWSPPTGMLKAFDVASITPTPSILGESLEQSYALQAAAGATGIRTSTINDPLFAGIADAGNGHTLALRPASASSTVLGSGTATIAGPGAVTLVTTTFPTSAVTFANGDRLVLDVIAPSAAACSVQLSFDAASVLSRLVVATIVPEGVLSLLLLAPGLPFLVRRWKARQRP